MNEVEQIKQKLDIVDVIGGYIQLKPAGRNFKALSPFHAEKTPSFMVSPDKGIWHDFSADEGGDIFSFVMRVEGVSFPEALEILAKRAGVPLKPRTSGHSGPNKGRLYEAVEFAVKYYHLSLSKNKDALSYLRKTRGLSTDIIKRFQLGYAPQSWDALSSFLTKQKFTKDELIRAGLVAQKSGSQSVYDMFRGRILFPIFDNQNRPVGFSGRVLPGDEQGAKYINTAQTAIYNKSTAIYGLTQAKEAIRESDEVVIVEGNVDVLTCADNDFMQIVACSGTALTREQLKILSRLTKNIKICFDEDSAGIKATQRAIELAQGIDIKLEVITLIDVKDPDELIRKDKRLWIKAVKEAQYAVDYLFAYSQKTFSIRTANGKKQVSSFLMPILRALSDSVEQDHYIKLLAETLGVNEDSIRQKLSDTEKAAPQASELIDSKGKDEPSQNRERLTKLEEMEESLLKLALAFPVARPALLDVDPSSVTVRHADIFFVLHRNPKATLSELVKVLPQKENDVKILSLKGEREYSDLSEHDIGLEAYTQVHRLQKLILELNKRQIAKQIAEAEAAGDKETANQLLNSYQELINEE